MNKKLLAELEDMLAKARFRLLKHAPFFGDLVFGMPVIWCDTLNPPTAATNGQWVKLHPDFFKMLTTDERSFLLAHETMHCAMLHCLRRGKRKPGKWNVACDIVINYLLTDHSVGRMPKGGVYDYDLYREGEGKPEKIYDLLKDEACNEPGQGTMGVSGSSLDVVEDAPEGEAEAIKAKWQNKLQEALDSAKAKGNVSGNLEQFVEAMTEPNVTWEDHIRNTAISTKGTDKTWTRRNRRHASSGINLPGLDGEVVGDIVYAIDCSGSTSDQMVGQVATNGRALQEEFRPEKIHVLYFDSEIKKHEEYGPDDPLDVKVYGRGGTAFSPIFKYIEDNDLDPSMCIVCTDLYCDDYGPKPDYPVLWCVMESTKQDAPWGEVLVVK